MGLGAVAAAEKLHAISDLIRLPRQQGTLLLLWPTMWSLFIASGGKPGLKLLLIFIAGTFLMRSAGCAINDIADRNFDPFVERTRSRPLANGRLKVKEAALVSAALSLIAFALVLQLNRLTILLSFAGLALAGAYPFVKRISHFPQVVLGMAFGWGAVMAWSAAKGEVGAAALFIFLANIFWSTAYDTIYALMDREDDLRVGVKSTAIFFGESVHKALFIMYILFALALGAGAALAGLGAVFFSGLAVCLALFLAVAASVRKTATREGAFRGFQANAFIGGLILFFIVIDLNI
ncbi:MAG: 4-hydroxybenzoate octaprenyltransferase [Candidatus Methylomirabilis sp.]|nr:4-hydroxybenzoate octaprenyltransferase [Deltaproteobacteria bacterium]